MRPRDVIVNALGSVDDLKDRFSVVLDETTEYPSAIFFSLGRDVEFLPDGSMSLGDEAFQIEFNARPGFGNYDMISRMSEQFAFLLAATNELVEFSFEPDNGFEVGAPSKRSQPNQLITRVCRAVIRGY